MYVTGGGTMVLGGAIGVGSLATTGTNALLFAVVGLVLIVIGLLLVRAVAVRPERP